VTRCFSVSGLGNALGLLLCGRFDPSDLFGRGRVDVTGKGDAMRKILGVFGILVLTAGAALGQMASRQDKDGVYMAGKGLTPAKLIQGGEAAYPISPDSVGIKHVCALVAVIGADGMAEAIQIINQQSSPFDAAAIAAVRQSKFEAGIYQGNPVPTYITLWVPFNLAKGMAPIVGTPSQKGASAPMPRNSVEAEVPEQARRDKITQAMVVVRVRVTDTGLPVDATVVGPAGHGFDESALKAAAKYRFRPATLHGVPVPMDIFIEVNFMFY